MADGKYACSKWIVTFLILGAVPAFAIDRGRLDRCQDMLGACYDICKSHGTPAKLCNKKCTTDLCGLPWKESYGSFLDQRIEDDAAGTRNRSTGGLKRSNRGRRNVDEPKAPAEEQGFLGKLWPFAWFQ